MRNILNDLHSDHINFSKLLNMLTGKLEILKGEERIPNFSLMLDAVDYLQNYADLYHHPKEDLIYEFYLRHTDENCSTINRLTQEHINLKETTEQLQHTIDGILHGAIIPKDKFTQQLEEFIDQQRNHLNIEEEHIFPLLKKKLHSNDWQHIEKTIPQKIDPLFGGKVEKQYQALYERILNSSL